MFEEKVVGFKNEKKADKFLQSYFKHCTGYPVCQFFKYNGKE